MGRVMIERPAVGGERDSFDAVIRTQAEFETLIASPTWLDAASVCFVGDGGTLKFTRSDGIGLLIPQTVKQIQGMDSATIEVTKFVYNSTTNKAAFYYSTRPTSNDCSIRNLAISVSASDITTSTVIAYAVRNCKNLYSCTATASASGSHNTSSARGEGIGFADCENLYFCVGSGRGSGSTGNGDQGGYGTGIGFKDCTNITSCNGTGTGVGNAYGSTAGTGFSACSNILSSYGYGAYGGSPKARAYQIGFSACVMLANCVGAGNGNTDGYGFESCIQLTNCSGYGTGSYSGHSFYGCSYLNGCKQGTKASSSGFLGGTNVKVDTATVVAS